jgi:hypothetical protein
VDRTVSLAQDRFKPTAHPNLFRTVTPLSFSSMTVGTQPSESSLTSGSLFPQRNHPDPHFPLVPQGINCPPPSTPSYSPTSPPSLPSDLGQNCRQYAANLLARVRHFREQEHRNPVSSDHPVPPLLHWIAYLSLELTLVPSLVRKSQPNYVAVATRRSSPLRSPLHAATGSARTRRPHSRLHGPILHDVRTLLTAVDPGAPSPSKSGPWPPRSTMSDDLTVTAGESLVN